MTDKNSRIAGLAAQMSKLVNDQDETTEILCELGGVC